MNRKQRQMKYNTRLPTIIFVSVLIGFVVGLYFYEPLVEELIEEGIILPELSTLGYIPASIDVDSNNLYLSTDCYQLSMLISDDQALSIIRGMDKTVTRPLTHDIFWEVADNFGLEILLIKIESFEDNAFRASIIIKQDNKILDIDSRPSDAVALAVRMDKTVYVKEDLLRAYGTETC